MSDRRAPTPLFRRTLAACALFLLAATGATTVRAAEVQWYVEILAAEPGRPQGVEARVFTQKGFRVRLYRRANGAIWAELVLPRLVQAAFDENRLPSLQIDDNLPYDLNTLMGLEAGFQRRLSQVIGKRLNFLVWKSATTGFIPPLLREMMNGQTLRIAFATATGDNRQVAVPLARANQAIARFLDISPLVDATPDDDAALANFDTIAGRHMRLCEDLRFSGDDGNYARCRRVFERCSEKPDQTTTEFQACLTAP